MQGAASRAPPPPQYLGDPQFNPPLERPNVSLTIHRMGLIYSASQARSVQILRVLGIDGLPTHDLASWFFSLRNDPRRWEAMLWMIDRSSALIVCDFLQGVRQGGFIPNGVNVAYANLMGGHFAASEP
jgi:hypothetical protein